jgi:hypothetical protein
LSQRASYQLLLVTGLAPTSSIVVRDSREIVFLAAFLARGATVPLRVEGNSLFGAGHNLDSITAQVLFLMCFLIFVFIFVFTGNL